jgi:HPt (histidine-containing phosphotransfer) domain-containing protein
MSHRDDNYQGASLCNLEYLLVNLGRNQETAEHLIRIFLENYPLLSQRLLDAAESGDIPELKNTLHDIRSSCVLFSAHRCVNMARDFEEALRQGSELLVRSRADGSERMVRAKALCGYLQEMAGELAGYLNKKGA